MNSKKRPTCGDCQSHDIELVAMASDDKRWKIVKVVQLEEIKFDDGSETGIYVFEVEEDQEGFNKCDDTKIICMSCGAELTDHETYKGI